MKNGVMSSTFSCVYQSIDEFSSLSSEDNPILLGRHVLQFILSEKGPVGSQANPVRYTRICHGFKIRAVCFYDIGRFESIRHHRHHVCFSVHTSHYSDGHR